MTPPLAYSVAIIAVALTSLLGGRFTASSVRSPWYACVRPDPFTPPRVVFPIVWTALYVCLAIALARTLSLSYPLTSTPSSSSTTRILLALHAANLTLNVAWTYAFFQARRPSLALGLLGVLLAIAVTLAVQSYPLDPIVTWLLAPYIAWLGFACLLNARSAWKEGRCGETT